MWKVLKLNIQTIAKISLRLYSGTLHLRDTIVLSEKESETRNIYSSNGEDTDRNSLFWNIFIILTIH